MTGATASMFVLKLAKSVSSRACPQFGRLLEVLPA
jgi:hypothetical protein